MNKQLGSVYLPNLGLKKMILMSQGEEGRTLFKS
jgi:hypothetical protein